ncbi:hypothetical protein [Micromonospora sp. NPDC000668]|uniref:hypothetical protein n=1 Tax=Micromonospora sp. NPDC000668 TaxID=3364219 RepID=UPI00369B203B
MFLTQVGDVRPAGFEDPQPEQAQERDQGEVVRVRGPSGCGDQGFELQVTQSEVGDVFVQMRGDGGLDWHQV